MSEECIRRKSVTMRLNRWKNQIVETYGENDEYVKCLDDVVNIVDDIPAADVVEVDSVIPFVRVCDQKEYIKNSEKLINEYLAELLERFGIRCLAQRDNINGTVKFWAEKMDGCVNDGS